MRPTGTLVPRMRQAPDGGKEGGSQPTDISVINRRVLLAPALPIDQGEKNEADVKKLLPTLDIGSHINARFQPLGIAGARQLGKRKARSFSRFLTLPVENRTCHFDGIRLSTFDSSP